VVRLAALRTVLDTVQCSAVQYTPPQVGDAHRWQLKIVLLFWIKIFKCGTQFITTDFMTYESKILFHK
jgi:hypothetical protein